MTRIEWYLLREWIATTAAILLILLVFFLVHRLGQYFTQAASGLLNAQAIWPLLGLQALRVVPLLLPFALLLAMVLTLGRLQRDSEMAAMHAAGFGGWRLYRPILVLCLPLMGLLWWLNTTGVPAAMKLHSQLQAQARHEAELSLFTPGRFRELLGGKLVFYVGRLNAEQGFEEVFIQRHTADHLTTITTAWRGFQTIDEAQGVRYLVLEAGHRYEGYPGTPDFDSVTFDRLALRLDQLATPNPERQRREALTMDELLATNAPWASAEVQRRQHTVWMVLVLASLAPLIARAPPRSGRYSRVLAALLVWVIYVNLLQTGETLLRQERLPEGGLWLIHGGFLAIAWGWWRWKT